jgi:hypothetical protein
MLSRFFLHNFTVNIKISRFKISRRISLESKYVSNLPYVLAGVGISTIKKSTSGRGWGMTLLGPEL